MPYDLKKLNGEFNPRRESIPPGYMSAMDVSNDTLSLINKLFDPLENLGIDIGEDGKVPEIDGVPRIFVMQPNENGIDSVHSLDAAGLKYGSREFWLQAQKGNVFAYPAGSDKPVQLKPEIYADKKPRHNFSKPVDMEAESTLPESQPYRKPGRLTRFINRFISGYRSRDCEIYRERSRFSEMAKKRSAGMAKEMSDLKIAEKAYAKRKEKQQQKDDMIDFERSANLKTHGKQFYRDLVAPTPVFHEEHEKVVDENGKTTTNGHYTKAEFNELEKLDKRIEDYSVGGQQLTVDEYCGLVASCSHDTKNALKLFQKTDTYDRTLYKTMQDLGYSEQEILENISRQCSTFITDDQMKGDLRNNQGEVYGVAINPGRKQAFEVLDEYKKGNPAPLAGKIKFEIENLASTSSEIKDALTNGGRNHVHFCNSLAGLLDKDPALKEEAMKQGLKQKDIDAIKGLNEYSKAVGLREDARSAMAKAIYEDRELSYAEKQKYAKDILTANLMDTMIATQNYEFDKSGKTFNDEIDRMEQVAEKNGLDASGMLHHWKQKPEERPFPPKGKFYKDQAYKIVSGFKSKYNQHPEMITDLSDPENGKYIEDLTAGVAENHSLASMSTKDLFKALKNGSSVYSGAKLVDEADKVAEKMRLDELGIGDMAEEKEIDELNKSVDYGHRSMVHSGPSAI